jgi:hypothetical protein
MRSRRYDRVVCVCELRAQNIGTRTHARDRARTDRTVTASVLSRNRSSLCDELHKRVNDTARMRAYITHLSLASSLSSSSIVSRRASIVICHVPPPDRTLGVDVPLLADAARTPGSARRVSALAAGVVVLGDVVRAVAVLADVLTARRAWRAGAAALVRALALTRAPDTPLPLAVAVDNATSCGTLQPPAQHSTVI